MMTERFLVDTSAWILALRKDFLPKVKDRIDHLLKGNAIVISGIIKLEILGGTKTQKEFQVLKRRLDSLDMVETDGRLWDQAASLAFRLRRTGLTVPYTDIVVAACAQRINATVIHADAHFDRIGENANLNVESYVKAVSKRDKR
jgi:hypothetical protein